MMLDLSIFLFLLLNYVLDVVRCMFFKIVKINKNEYILNNHRL